MIQILLLATRSKTSNSNSRKSYSKHLRRTFWMYRGIGILKLEGMHRQTGETYVDPDNERDFRLIEVAV